MAFKTWAAGDVLTASDVNTYLMRQAVITCTSATRPSAPSEGMTIYETDTDKILSYSGTAWETGLVVGAWTSWTPAFVDSGAGTNWAIGDGTISGKYARFGRVIVANFTIVMGSTTTFGTDIMTITLPVDTAWTTDERGTGSAIAKDASPTNTYPLATTVVGQYIGLGALAASSTYATWDAVTNTKPFTWANGDRIDGTVIYEADA